MQANTLLVTGEGDIRHVPVHAAPGESMRPVHRHALSLVHGQRIAVGQIAIGVEIDNHPFLVVEAYDQRVFTERLQCPDCAVADAHPAIILGEEDPVANGEVELEVFRRPTHSLFGRIQSFGVPETTGLAHQLARTAIEGRNVAARGGQDQIRHRACAPQMFRPVRDES